MEKTDLRNRGFKEAAQSLGSIDTFKSTANIIRSGNLIDSSIEIPEGGRIDAEKAKIKDKIDKIEEKRDGLLSRKTNLTNIRNEIQDKLDKLKINPSDPTVVGPNGPFNPPKFYSTALIFLGLTCFLLYYYVGVPYMSFVKECDESTAMFPDFNTWLVGVSNNLPLLLFPLVFFAFGISLHIALEYKNKTIKSIIITFLILITFILDLRMAIQIHECLDTNHYMGTGEHLPKWYESGLVYILFILGFVLFFLWSFIYHFLIKEYGKKNIISSLQESLHNTKRDISEIGVSISAFDGHLTRLKNRFRLLEGGDFITDNMIEGSYRLYKSGFLNFLTAGGDEYLPIIQEIEAFEKNFFALNKDIN